MKLLAKLTTLFLLVVVPHVDAVECGKWYSNSCRGDDDIRYDPDASDSIKDQHPFWAKSEGLWKVTLYQYGPDGQPVTPIQEPVAFPFTTIPYEKFPYLGFYNITVDGSRYYQHRYFVYPPANPDFCAQPLEDGYINVYFNETCGEAGLAVTGDLYGTSSYERDGSIIGLPSSRNLGRLILPYTPTNEQNTMLPVGDLSAYLSAELPDGYFGSESFTFLDDTLKAGYSTGATFVNGAQGFQLDGSFLTQYERIETAEEFLQEIQQAWEDNKVPEADRIPVPMTRSCFAAICPNEEEWCKTDPECSTSPYQEPDGTLKAGAIAGFVILGATIIVVVIVGFFLYHLKKQKQRYQEAFAKRIAEDIRVEGHFKQLDGEALAEEFKKIDAAGDGNGTISKEELWNFINGDHGGGLNEKDFNALFNAIDVDGSGQIDFMEFCAFMQHCNVAEIESKD